MEVIILVALVFVIISLANKYLKVPMDNSRRYDGINNRFYGEGYTGDTPVPPSDDEDHESGEEDGRESGEEDGREDQQAAGQYEIPVQPDRQQDRQPDRQPDHNTVGHTADLQDEQAEQDEQADNGTEPGNDDSLGAGGSDQKAPAKDAAIYGNIDNAPGVVIDTEVRIDAAMPQDPGKS